ncbi:MAG: type restriction enzyme subunit, partial [Thermosediminibacterales bacterium]|nr:type restriction enzyme subunit [Thermosediminibacterales bacterium]
MEDYAIAISQPSSIWIKPGLISGRVDSSFFHIKYINYLDQIINCGLPLREFKEICSRMKSGPFGSALLASAYVEEGIPFIRPLNCKDYIVENNDLVYITEEDSSRLKGSRFPAGALLITKIGNGIGDVAVVPSKIEKCNISGNLMGVEVKHSYDNYYVLLVLKSKYGQNQMWQRMMNSAKPKIDMDSIKSLLIPIPSPEIQKYIGD